MATVNGKKAETSLWIHDLCALPFNLLRTYSSIWTGHESSSVHSTDIQEDREKERWKWWKEKQRQKRERTQHIYSTSRESTSHPQKMKVGLRKEGEAWCLEIMREDDRVLLKKKTALSLETFIFNEQDVQFWSANSNIWFSFFSKSKTWMGTLLIVTTNSIWTLK